MEQQRKMTYFAVDTELCFGCGDCIKACPMKILKLQDDICVITDPTRCLECRTCMRDCGQDAIDILESEGDADYKGIMVGTESDETGEPVNFTPIIDTLKEYMAELEMEQSFSLDGMDIRALDDFKLEGEKCFTRLYKAAKLEKIGISSVNFFGAMRTDVISITPGPEYDIPYYVMDWCESEDHIFYICDLMASDDPGRDEEYLQKYLYEPLEDLYHKYRTVPGLTGSVFHWVRAIHSPYLLTGTVEKNPAENVEMLQNCAVDYLKAWLELYRNTEPQDINSERMRLINDRRKTIRKLYVENDPGAGALNKFLGDELEKVQMAIIEP